MCVWSDRDTCWGMTWQLQQVPACNCHGLVSPRLTCIFSLHLTVYVITVSLLKRLQNNNKKRNDDTQIDLPDLVMLFTVGDNVLMPHCMDNCWNACGSKRYCSLISFTVNHWGCFFFFTPYDTLGSLYQNKSVETQEITQYTWQVTRVHCSPYDEYKRDYLTFNRHY